MKKPAQFYRCCIFCGGRPLTEEHIWSKFLTNRNILEPVAEHWNSQTRFSYQADGWCKTSTQKKFRQGHLANRRLKVVCKKCNNTWMSKIVESAAPIILRINNEHVTILSQEDQISLSAWVALSCIIAEHTDRSSMSVSECDRAYMFAHGKPSHKWNIFIACCEGFEWTPMRYRHHGSTIFIRNKINDIEQQTDYEKNFLQITTYTINNVLFHAMSSTSEFLADLYNKKPPEKLKKIWPPENPILWPLPRPSLSDREAFEIADGFNNFMLSSFPPPPGYAR